MIRIEYIELMIVRNEVDCWLWQGTLNKKGYPNNSLPYKGKTISPQRYLYEQHIGKIPNGYVIDHKECKNHSCVNPEHLEAVTNTENIRRGKATKLTIEKVIEIKKLYLTGNYRQIDLAKMFKVGRSTIAMALCNGNWKDTGTAVGRNKK